MTIDAISKHFPGIEKIAPLQQPNSPAAPVKGKESFGDMFENALKEVDQLQHQADQSIEGLTLKKDGFTPHGTMVALEKADIAFQLMSAVRSKILRAYEEVIRTQV